MDVSDLRTEIKTWERQFKEQNGRDPTVQDIKDTPGMPNKYKLYKKLSKQHAVPSASTSSSKAPFPISADRPPSTPPHQPSSILSKHKSRAVRTETSELTSNPFSPVKNKGKERALAALDSLSISASSRANTNANPFTTPRKTRTQSRSHAHVSRKDPSPDPFPLIPAQHSSTPSSHQDTAAWRLNPTIAQSHAYRDVPSISVSSPPEYLTGFSETPVTRARKRLRGEQVAPSPVKEKRARVVLQQSSSLAFVKHSTLLDLSGDEDMVGAGKTESGDIDEDEDTFFGESPVKRPSSGKHFKLLFDESDVSLVQQHIKPRGPPHTKSATLVGFPFVGEPKHGHRQIKSSSRAVSPESSDDDMAMDWDTPEGKKIAALDISLNEKPFGKKTKSSRTGLPRAVLPGRDDLWAPAPALPTNGGHTGNLASSTASRLGVHGAKAGPSKPKDVTRTTRKRSASGDEMDVDEPLAGPVQPPGDPGRTKSQLLLLPPSPPPPDTRSSASRTGDRGRGKGFPASSSRKKAKLMAELFADEDGETNSAEDDDEVNVRERVWSWNIRRKAPEDESEAVDDSGAEADSEPEFDPTLYRPAPAPAPVVVEEGTLEVDVPEQLRDVLAINVEPPTKTYDVDEERVVRELLYGRREGHYDAQRGGEIWGAGEVMDDEEEAEDGKGDDTDEWEGEPVPWEVGEL